MIYDEKSIKRYKKRRKNMRTPKEQEKRQELIGAGSINRLTGGRYE